MKPKLKYEGLAETLRKEILEGTAKQGQRLRTEQELTEMYGLSRQTVRRSLNILEEDGFIRRKRGSGTYVSYSPPMEKQIMRIGVVVTYISDFIFPAILRGIDSVLAENSYSMVLKSTQNRIDNERAVLQGFLQDPVGGLIIEGTKTAFPNPNMNLYRELIARNIPIVFINSFYRQLQEPRHVVMDDHEGGRLAVQYLYQQGHRDIMGIFKSDDMQGIGRYSGFVDGITQYGLPLSDDRLLWYNTENKQEVLGSLKARFQTEPYASVSAIVCYNDEIAMRTVEALQSRGSISSKVVVCFDQSVYSERFSGKIVALKHPKEVLGHKAASMLISIINGHEEQSFVFPWEFET